MFVGSAFPFNVYMFNSFSCPLNFIGFMLHRKPLYVAMAQRKEDRKAQLQLHYAQRMAGLSGPSTPVIPGGYSPFYYSAPSGVVSPVPHRPGLMYQPLGMRPEWTVNGFAPPTRPPFQLPPAPVSVSTYYALMLAFIKFLC